MNPDQADSQDKDEDSNSSEHRLRFHEMFQFSAEGQIVTDIQGVIEQANLAASTLLECSKEFLVGKPLGLFVAVGFRRRFYESLIRHLGTNGSDEFETNLGRADASRQVVVRASTIEPRTGNTVQYHWQLLDVTGRRRAEAARDELRQRLVSRRRTSVRGLRRELHDSVGQLHAALILGLRAVRDAAPLPSAALAKLDEVQKVAEDLGRAAHDIAIRLRPTVLDDLGLRAALRHDLDDWSVRSGVEVQFQAVGMEPNRLPTEIETALYRVVQEGLTNILKHAKAQLVSVVVERQERQAIAVIEDDGVGFNTESPVPAGRLGILGMRERLELLGGNLELESSAGSGTSLIARVPLKPERVSIP